MKWVLRNKITNDMLSQTFESKELAESHMSAMGACFDGLFEALPDTDSVFLGRVLTEGLAKGDLRKIILPQISIDEYIPGDPKTDNVVIAFFIKGVPEAVIPFRDFVMKSKGMLDVAYGDSDTIPDTSIVYAEMSRNKFRFDDLNLLMDQVAMLAGFDIEDFSIVFPTSSDRHPYSSEAIMGYFNARTSKDNWRAQKQAIDAEKDDDISPEEAKEAMIEHLVETFNQ